MRFPQYKLGLNVPGVLSIKHIKFRCAWIILQSLTRERFNGERKRKNKGGKKSKQCMLVMFIVASDGSFVFKTIAIWRSKGPRCFEFF